MVRGKDAKTLIRRIQDAGGHAALTRMISKIRRETGLEL